MTKQIIHGQKAQQKILAGVKTVAKIVGSTIGPRGRNVMIEKQFGAPMLTNDGVTVAREIAVDDKFEQMGVATAIDVASRTNDTAGDGTTTATILLAEMLEIGMQKIADGVDPIALEDAIDAAATLAIENIKKSAKPVKSIKKIAQIATISAGNEEIGKKIAEVSEKVGSEGVIKVEDSKTMTTEISVARGMQIENGYLSGYFVTDSEKMRAIFTDTPILLTDKKISSIKEILPLMEQLANAGKKELVIIAEDVDGDALATLVVNKLRGIFNALVIKSPGFGENKTKMLDDIAILTGGAVISEKLGLKLENVQVSDLGRADVESHKDKTIIVGKNEDKKTLTDRITQLRTEIETCDSDFNRKTLQERLARLAGGIGIIAVGASTEVEQKEKKLRVEDAVNAVGAARAEGISLGGGVALARAAEEIRKNIKSDKHEGDITNVALLSRSEIPRRRDQERNSIENAGAEIVATALEAPIKLIATNAGFDGDEVLQKVRKMGGNAGFDAKTGAFVDDLFAAGIIDPALVHTSAISFVASAAKMLLTTQVAIVNEKDEKEPMKMGM